jgi:hypothetical protein
METVLLVDYSMTTTQITCEKEDLLAGFFSRDFLACFVMVVQPTTIFRACMHMGHDIDMVVNTGIHHTWRSQDLNNERLWGSSLCADHIPLVS